ncbi:hypothetical protein BOTBODRAFT_39287 [Botryobasidium botryosum FD-172 SS1]|uniref:ADF-H domain-containing protein n=1 Tax=Botryobasidium botryosum (strain FD-172 SS1) TaxID=930990 RepID=A0A067M4U1_BOTB1|nr:hypothetical protein BOTBODRAFT_39287 [Botryobasidium botryosum FD-172 SS1]
MSADLSDPNINAVYSEITSMQPTNWLILSYGETRDKLSLHSSGEGGIEELQEKIAGGTDVLFAFAREERSFITISFVPEGVSGVRRARALVHSRAVASYFKAQHAILNATKAEDVTAAAIRTKLKLAAPDERRTGNISTADIRERLASFSPVPSDVPSSPPSPSRDRPPTPRSPLVRKLPSLPGSMHILPRSPSLSEKQIAALPPTPPNDDDTPTVPEVANGTHLVEMNGNGTVPPNGSPLQNGYVPRTWQPSVHSLSAPSEASRSESPANIRLQTPSPALQQQVIPEQPSPRTAAQEHAALSRAKWAAEATQPPAPRSSEWHRQREAEAEEQARFDAERAARLKHEREERLRIEIDEEEKKRIAEQEQARKRAAERLAEEQRRREDLERSRAVGEQRRRAETAERARKLNEIEEAKRMQRDARRKKEEARLAAKREFQGRLDASQGNEEIILAGNLAVQTSNSLHWRRRYFELSRQGLTLYKSEENRAQPVDFISLASRVSGVKVMPHEFLAIPHSFTVEFTDEHPYQFFADTADEKDLLVVALKELTGA